MVTITNENLSILRHIFDARIDKSNDDAYIAWSSARDVFEYAIANNTEALRNYDYLTTTEEDKKNEGQP